MHISTQEVQGGKRVLDRRKGPLQGEGGDEMWKREKAAEYYDTDDVGGGREEWSGGGLWKKKEWRVKEKSVQNEGGFSNNWGLL